MTWVLFGENVTPNAHKLASEFVLFDNFYVSADVSADGHNWTTAAIAPDYVQKMWPNKYANRRKEYDFEEQDPLSIPPAGNRRAGPAFDSAGRVSLDKRRDGGDFDP